MRCLPFLCCRIDLSPDPVLSPAATSPKWSAPDLSKFQFYLPAEDRYHSWSRCRRGRLPTPRESAARRLCWHPLRPLCSALHRVSHPISQQPANHIELVWSWLALPVCSVKKTILFVEPLFVNR